MAEPEETMAVVLRIVGRHLLASRFLHAQIVFVGVVFLFWEPLINSSLPFNVKVFGFVGTCAMVGVCGAVSLCSLLGKLNNGTPLSERSHDLDQ